MNKKNLMRFCVVLMMVVVCFNLTACGNKDKQNPNPNYPHEDEYYVSEEHAPNYVLKDEPTILVPESIKLVKEAMGDKYYPNVEMTADEVYELFGINKDDCEFAIGHKCDDGHYDMFIAIRAKDGMSGKIDEAVAKYTEAMVANEELPDNVREAFKGAIRLHNPDGYVYLIALFGDLDSLDPNMITETVETQCLEMFDLVVAEISKAYVAEPKE